ncbi:extracellular solute-binding protein [Stigmatella hybrida]|uniref:extracellular solute-binding protein n=1 Tax=Stigmatella hybrida TaxID=394097 RepID=UPI001CDB107D|nr:extracellular solute-binding protein [Stigmatella hybrida]
MPSPKWMLLISAVTCPLVGCGDSEPEPTPGPRTQLRVPLYSYIPDAAGDQFRALGERLEREFEQLHPDVDLVINPTCFKDDLYEPAELARSLRGEGDCPYDVVETDTSLLGEIVETGAVRPWPALPQGPQWHPASLEASTYQGQLYGVPHWLCAHYLLSRSEAVSSAPTVDALVQALDGLQTPAMNLTGNWLGSWNLPALYFDAWTDSYGAGNVQSAVSTQYDPDVLAGMRALVQGCETANGNPCIDGTYDASENFDLPTHLFADGQADALLGYSERLHTVLKRRPEEATAGTLRISLAPLGQGNQPIVFTDSFFLGKNCTGACEQAALRFTEYMSQASTYSWLLMSEDAPATGRVPRYLMPAALEVYDTPALKADPFYPSIGAATREAGAFPNRGLYPIRKQMRDDLQRTLAGEG